MAPGTPTPVKDEDDFPYMRHEKGNRWEVLKLDIYNPTTKEFLGRTAKSWGGITLFYIIFFACLAAFFAVCMKGLMYTLSEDEPRWKGSSSLIGTNPGMGFRPMYHDVEEGGSLVWYDAKNQSSVDYWVNALDEFTAPYYNQSLTEGMLQCDYDRRATRDKGCVVDTEKWGPCSAEKGYSYNRSSPCIFIKLNKIFGWVPDYYKLAEELPEDMPDFLKQHIHEVNTTNPKMLNSIWISCSGENPGDRESIGPISYVNGPAIPGFYFPYENQKRYLSPVVAIQFEKPTLNVLLNIECRAWAKNIQYVRYKAEREGSVHMELLVD